MKKKILSWITALAVTVTMLLGGSAAVFADENNSGLIWASNAVGSSQEKSISAPAYYNGNVYAVLQEGNNAYLNTFNERDGKDSVVAIFENKSTGYNTLAPVIDAKAGNIYVPLTGGIAIVPIAGGTIQYVETKEGYQTISPIAFDDEYLYIGTYSSGVGDYYRVDKKNIESKIVMVDNTSFYWAGACPTEINGVSYVMFGSDGGNVFLYNNETKSLEDTFAVDGNIRSSIVSDGNGSYYFSTVTGKLYKINIEDNKIASASNYPVELTSGSTCTPVLDGDKIYVGTDGGTVDVFNLDGTKDQNASLTGFKGAVKGLIALKGKVYASCNWEAGGIYNVTDQKDAYVPTGSMKGYNAYLPVTNEEDNLFFKNDSGCIMAIDVNNVSCDGDSNRGSIGSDDGDKTGTASVYVTVSDKGTIKIPQEKVEVKDIDKDGKLTINDALYIAHEKYYKGGAAAGYSSATNEYGLHIKKLWGDTSEAFGYRLNNASAWSLEDPVKDGDYVNAYIYLDPNTWSDVYSWFDKNSLTVKSGEKFNLSLYAAGYDEQYNETVKPVNNAIITINGEKTIYKTDELGQVTIDIPETGAYLISAESLTENLVPPICKVTVSDKAGAVQNNYSGDKSFKTGDDFNPVLFAVIAVIALIVSVAVVFYRKRFNN